MMTSPIATHTARYMHSAESLRGVRSEVDETRLALESALNDGADVERIISGLNFVLKQIGRLDALDENGIKVVRTILGDARWLLSEALGKLEKETTVKYGHGSRCG